MTRRVLESSIERAAKKKLDAAGCIVLKVGFDGWPDRLVLEGGGRHRWIEFKRPGGKLRKAQEKRKELLERIGDTVDVIGSEEKVG
jgi:hypothetical protein